MTYLPTAEQVAVAYLKTVPEVAADKVATSLPGDPSVWAATGFVQVTVVGGAPSPHTPLHGPVVQVSCWANTPNSQKPPWGHAGSLAAAIVWATYQHQPVELDLGDGFHPARLLSVWPLAEPRRVLSDEAGFARVDVDIAFGWTLAVNP